MNHCINCGLAEPDHFASCATAKANRLRSHVAPVTGVPDDLRRIQAELEASEDPDDREAARGLDGIADRLAATFANMANAINDYENSIEADDIDGRFG